MKIIVCTCNKYDFLIPGFTYLFNKYWPNREVDVLGYRTPPEVREYPLNFKFKSLGQSDQAFTDGLFSYVKRQEASQLVLLLDDYWLIAPVDVKSVARMSSEVALGAAKGDLSTNTVNCGADAYGKGLFAAKQDAPYRTSTQPCIWRLKYLIKLLTPRGLNPWQFELQQTAYNDGAKIVGLNYQTYVYANVVLKGNPDPLQLLKIPPEDIQALKAMGYTGLSNNSLKFKGRDNHTKL